jgi:hypothetical protein
MNEFVSQLFTIRFKQEFPIYYWVKNAWFSCQKLVQTVWIEILLFNPENETTEFYEVIKKVHAQYH